MPSPPRVLGHHARPPATPAVVFGFPTQRGEAVLAARRAAHVLSNPNRGYFIEGKTVQRPSGAAGYRISPTLVDLP
jgi:hypothetical protein